VTQSGSGGFVPTVLVHSVRDKVRTLSRELFPRKRWRLIFTRSAEETASSFRSRLVDAAIVDLRNPDDATWSAASLAAEFPSTPFFALLPARPSDGATLSRCVTCGCADFIVEGVDEPIARDLVGARGFAGRFRSAISGAAAALGLATPLQQRAWQVIISHAGMPVTTDVLADSLGLSREHLSRKFAASGGANLKRIIDLVRIVAAAELAKNPGLDVRDVARILGFASSSHLAVAAARISGTRSASLARLRTVDLIERFSQGRTRSRA